MEVKKTTTGIPTFGLYGESNLRQQSEFIHIEDISSRSQQHDWLIKPHRHGKLFQLLFVFDGSIDLCLNDKQLVLNGNWVISIPPGHIHGFHFPADTQGLVLTVVDSLLQHSQSIQNPYNFDELLRVPRTIFFDQEQPRLVQLKQYLQLIQSEFQGIDAGHAQMLQWLVNMVLMTLKRQVDNDLTSIHHPNSGKAKLVDQFRSLIDSHYREHWTVKDYSDSLHISNSTLSRLCKEHTGTAAKALIVERVVLEIKRRLIYTNEPLDQMAYTLGFKDPAYFSRFFKKQEGNTLSQYRADKNRETGTVVAG